MFVPATGAKMPLLCPTGYFCPDGSPAGAARRLSSVDAGQQPTRCPAGSTTLGVGAKSVDDCFVIAPQIETEDLYSQECLLPGVDCTVRAQPTAACAVRSAGFVK